MVTLDRALRRRPNAGQRVSGHRSPSCMNQDRPIPTNNNPLEPQAPQVTHRVQIEITWKSILRLLVGVLLIYAAVLLWPICRLLILAVLIAVALYPMVRWAVRKGWPQWVGLWLASATLLVVVVGCLAIIAPMALRQAAALGENLPKLREQILVHLPSHGFVRDALEASMGPGTVADSRAMLDRTMVLLANALGRLVNFAVVIVLAVYLMADGRGALKWLIVFFPAAEREKISQALGHVSQLISAYVAGQFLISALAAMYLFVVLELLGVPMALLLGLVAAICDIVPIIGFCVAVILAMVMGLSISPATAALIFALYGAYHLFENFFIMPRVYGKKLKLSKLAVPVAIAAGGLLAGMVGAIAALPLVAAYPVVERLWLAPKLAPDTVKAHQERTAS
jgi:predicted PurR-regulated permease PerM